LSSVCPGCGEKSPDEIDMKDVDLAPLDPVIGMRFTCPTCGNLFTHEGKDECPYCQEELDFSEQRNAGSSLSDKEVKISSGGNLEVGKAYVCNKCTVYFMPEAEMASCPTCNEVMVDGYNCKPFYSETEEADTQRKDSGELLHGHGDEFDQAAIDAAAIDAAVEEDKTLEQPLPDPQKTGIPISTRTSKEKHARSLKEMFKRVFGGGGI
jgi:hypothetical protein